MIRSAGWEQAPNRELVRRAHKISEVGAEMRDVLHRTAHRVLLAVPVVRPRDGHNGGDKKDCDDGSLHEHSPGRDVRVAQFRDADQRERQ